MNLCESMEPYLIIIMIRLNILRKMISALDNKDVETVLKFM